MNDKLRAAHDKLQEAVAEIVSGDEWKRMLKIGSKSRVSRMLIRAWLVLESRRGRGVGLPSRLIPHRHHPRAELQLAHELQVDTLR
jgi:hypothetical protein